MKFVLIFKTLKHIFFEYYYLFVLIKLIILIKDLIPAYSSFSGSEVATLIEHAKIRGDIEF